MSYQRHLQDCCIQQAAERRRGPKAVLDFENEIGARVVDPWILLLLHLNEILDWMLARLKLRPRVRRGARCGRPEADQILQRKTGTAERLVWCWLGAV